LKSINNINKENRNCNAESNQISADEKARLDMLFERNFVPLLKSAYNFAYRLTLDEDDAKDLVQDAYLKVYKFLNSFDEGTNAKAWLFRIIQNTFINNYRKKAKEPNKVDYQEVERFYNAEDVNVPVAPVLRVDSFKSSFGDEVTMALNKIGVDFRMAIILCDIEGFTYEEMSKILDIPIGTVRSRLHRARMLLKEILRDYAQKMGFKEETKT
jgi:RNA polymerase sigma-70 factor (ECF subfamily)